MQDIKLLSYETQNKVFMLINAYYQLVNENKKLKEKNEFLSVNISQLQQKLDMQAEEMAKMKLVKSVQGIGKSTDVKYKINELVREIDACIGMLNE